MLCSSRVMLKLPMLVLVFIPTNFCDLTRCMPKLTIHHTFVLKFQWVTGVWAGPEASQILLMVNVGCIHRDEPRTNIFHSHLSQCSLHATFTAVSCEVCEGVHSLRSSCFLYKTAILEVLTDSIHCWYAGWGGVDHQLY